MYAISWKFPWKLSNLITYDMHYNPGNWIPFENYQSQRIYQNKTKNPYVCLSFSIASYKWQIVENIKKMANESEEYRVTFCKCNPFNQVYICLNNSPFLEWHALCTFATNIYRVEFDVRFAIWNNAVCHFLQFFQLESVAWLIEKKEDKNTSNVNAKQAIANIQLNSSIQCDACSSIHAYAFMSTIHFYMPLPIHCRRYTIKIRLHTFKS